MDASPLAHIDTEHLLIDLAAAERKREEANVFFAGHRLLHIVYEDLVVQPADSIGKVLEFLHLPALPLSTRTRSQERRTLEMSIENYAEVRASLLGTPWEWLLKEDERSRHAQAAGTEPTS